MMLPELIGSSLASLTDSGEFGYSTLFLGYSR